jgi:hypothetical protein
MGAGAFGLTGATGLGKEAAGLGTDATAFGKGAAGLGACTNDLGKGAAGLRGAMGLGALGERGWALTTTPFRRSKIATNFPQKNFIL